MGGYNLKFLFVFFHILVILAESRLKIEQAQSALPGRNRFSIRHVALKHCPKRVGLLIGTWRSEPPYCVKNSFVSLFIIIL